jgi:hypothetical protein
MRTAMSNSLISNAMGGITDLNRYTDFVGELTAGLYGKDIREVEYFLSQTDSMSQLQNPS